MKFIPKIALILVLLFSFPVFSQPKSSDNKAFDDLYRSLETSDTRSALDVVLRTFREFGVRWHPDLVWVHNPYTEKINQYKNHDKQILISSFPKKIEAADYWESWSKALTDGKFDHRTFFKDDRESLLMANYNQLVVAVHEFGHHIDFLYNINTYGNEGFNSVATQSPLNCTEGFADQVAFVFAAHLAQDRRFDELRGRYLELITKLNGLIPEDARTSFSGISSVLEDCGKIAYAADPEKFSPTTNNEDFRRYVSVYFNRWRIMLTEKEFPNIRDFLEKRVLESFRRRIKLNETPVSVKTLGEILPPKAGPRYGAFNEVYFALDKTGEPRIFLASFKTEEKEDIYNEVWKDGEIELLNERSQRIAKVALNLPDNHRFPYIASFFSVDDGEFYLYLNPYLPNEAIGDVACKDRLLYQFRRVNNVWQEKLEIIRNENFYCLDDQAIVGSPNGKLYFVDFKGENDFNALADLNSTDKTSIYLSEIDRETLKQKEPRLYGTFNIADFPKLANFQVNAAISDEGVLLMPFANSATIDFQYGNLAEIRPGGQISTLAGTVNHYEDGDDKRLTGFSSITDLRQIDAKTIRILDWNSKTRGRYLREIRLR